MTLNSDLRLVDDEAAPAPVQPRVFVRTISAPPGLPWEQARAAGLEARMGAPLPLHGVAYQVRRLEGWAPGHPARFAAFYVRAAEVGDALAAEIEVDGRMLSVRFSSDAARRRRARALAAISGAAGGVALALAIALVFALGLRAQADARLESLEQRAAARLSQAQKLNELKRQTAALDQAQARSRGLDQVLDDLALVSAAKTPGAHIQAFHWDRGYAAVEVRGEAAPFTSLDRGAQRAAHELRPGVWLWGLAPASARAPAPAETDQ